MSLSDRYGCQRGQILKVCKIVAPNIHHIFCNLSLSLLDDSESPEIASYRFSINLSFRCSDIKPS